MKSKEICQDCTHYVKIRNEMNAYECHGLPPQMVAIPQQSPQGLMISVNSMYPRPLPDSQGCGLYESKAEIIPPVN